MNTRPDRILRSTALRATITAMTLVVVSVGGDLSAHGTHVDAPVTAGTHDPGNPVRDAPAGHDMATPVHHSCGTHLCLHQLDSSRDRVRLPMASGLPSIPPHLPPTMGVLLIASLDRPPRELS